MFEEIKRLLEVEEIKMTPADVGENLLRKSEDEVKEICLKRLIDDTLKEEKEEAKRKIEEEEEINRKNRGEEDNNRK